MKILVTGASGYVGNNLAHTLANNGHEVHALIRSDSARDYLQHPLIQVYHGNILDRKSISVSMQGCSQVYHTAGLVKLWTKNRDEFYEHNVGGTINVLETALENDVEKLVYTSSCSVWSAGVDHALTENDPRINAFDNDYDLSKHLAEKKVKEYSAKGLHTVTVNPSRIYGPGLERHSNGVNRFIQMILNHKVSCMPWRMKTTANYAYLDDVVNGHILAMKKGVEGERYILGGENISFRQFTDIINSHLKSKRHFIRIPTALLKTWGLYELNKAKIHRTEPFVTPALIGRANLDKKFDCSKAEKQLGYTITHFEDAIKNTIDFLKKKNYGQ
jgi:nucleoside-diphosphate-sugar epimerase